MVASSNVYEKQGTYADRKLLTPTEEFYGYPGISTDVPGFGREAWTAVKQGAVVNKVSAKFDVYVRPASAVSSGSTWTDPDTIEVWPVVTTYNGYYLITHRGNAANVWREADVQVNRDKREPMMAAKFKVEMPAAVQALNGLFMFRDLSGSGDCFLVHVRR